MLAGKRVVVTGGTGSFGKVIVRRLLEGEVGLPAKVVVFSRSEATQHQMRLDFQQRRVATDEIVYEEERHSRLHFQVGDIRDPSSVVSVLRDADVVFHAAALSSPWGPDAVFQSANVELTRRLLEGASAASTRASASRLVRA